MKKFILVIISLVAFSLSLMGCQSISLPSSFSSFMSASDKPTPSVELNDPAFWQGSPALIWQRLQYTSRAKLETARNTLTTADAIGWIELALISKRDSTDTQRLCRDLLAWREHYPNHPGNQLIPDNTVLNQLLMNPAPKHIALLLPLKGTYARAGRIVRSGFLNAYYLYKANGENPRLSFYDTSQTSNIAQLYQQASADGADFIVGPLLKNDVVALTRMDSFSIPVLALNYSDTQINNASFYEFGLLAEDEAKQVADRAIRAGLSRAIVIAPQNPWGKKMVAAFSARWQSLGGKIQDTWYFSDPSTFEQDVPRLLKIDPQADKHLQKKETNKTILEQQRRQDFDALILFSPPQTARQIVPLLRYYYAENIPIFASSSVYPGNPNPTRDMDLNGVMICDMPWNFQQAQGGKATDTETTDRLYAVGQDAYLLSLALPRLVQLKNFPLYGATGALVLYNQQIHRRLPCAVIRNGLL